jgi:hypothetical protein
LADGSGATSDVDLVADTGNPHGVLLGLSSLRRFRYQVALDTTSNFGPLEGGWLWVTIPQLGFSRSVLAFGSDVVLRHARNSSPDFEGLAGLPLLRMLEFGGDADWFWVRLQGITSRRPPP